MSDDNNDRKSESSVEFQDLTTSKIVSYLKEVNTQIDSSSLAFDQLLESNKILGDKVDSMTKENTELKEKVRNLDAFSDELRQKLMLLTEEISSLKEEKMLLKNNVAYLEKEKTQLQVECEVTENLWKEENSKCKRLEEEKLKTEEEKAQSNEEKAKFQLKIDQMIKENNDLAEIVKKAYQKMHQQKQEQESQIAILQEMLNQRTTQVTELKQRIQTLEKTLQLNMRKSSDDEIDFVLSRAPTKLTEDLALGRQLNQSGRSVSCGPWIMKESKMEASGNIKDQQRSEENAKLIHVMEEELTSHVVKVTDLSERLLEKQEELEKAREQLAKVQQSLQQQLQCARLTKEITEILKQEHKKQVAFYANQLTEFTEMHNSQLETFEFYKKRTQELEKYVNYPAVMEALIEKFNEEKKEWQKTTKDVYDELEKTKRNLNEKEEENKVMMEKVKAANQKFHSSELRLESQNSVIQQSALERELLQYKQHIAKLQVEKSHIQNSLQQRSQSFEEQLQGLLSLKRYLSQKVQLIKILQRQLEKTNQLYVREKKKNEESEHVIVQLTKSLEERTKNQDNSENCNFSQNKVESELRDHLVAELNNLKNIQSNYTQVKAEHENLSEELRNLKQQFVLLQQQNDAFEIEVHRLRSIIKKAEQAFNQDFNKLQQKNNQLHQTNANLHNNYKQRLQELQKLRTEFNQLKSASLAKTQELNRKVTSSQSEIVDLTEQLRMYELPMSNKERFELVRKWFGSRDWQKEDKCDFMGWTEEFFRNYAKIYCECGDVEEIDMVNCQYA